MGLVDRRLVLLIGFIILVSGCVQQGNDIVDAGEPIQDVIRLCEVENPRYDYNVECQKSIDEKYPGRECTFEIVNITPAPLGSCGDCIIECK